MIAAATIRQQIEAFARIHPADHATWSSMRHLVDEAPAACSRAHFVPGHFTASACVLSSDANSVLLVHHARLGRWLQPGGHVEPEDASLLAAAQREVLEECGLALQPPIGAPDARPIDLDIHAIPAHRSEPEHLHFDVRYAFVVAPGTPVVVSHESHAVRWVALADLDRHRIDDSARRMIDRACAALRSAAQPC